MPVLVLGGGWVGSRICLRDPSKFITTARSVEKLSELNTRVNAVHFDLLKEETWSNLPPKSDIEATIITFALSETHLPHLSKLWETHLATINPVICLGTSSCFHSAGYDSVVDETAPLTGYSVTGLPQIDRVKGEEWILARGATILHLSGIFGNEETHHRDSVGGKARNQTDGYGPPRTIKSFLSKGYYKNGFKLLNCIHINDIYKIVNIFMEKIVKGSDGADDIRGQRILTSCGAFRIQDLVRALNMDLLPEIIPPHSTMEKSKILSTAKLHALLPDDYEWTLPITGVEPISRGLPTVGPVKVDATGAAFDRQWELCRKNFRGKWQGRTTWYQKDKGEERGGKLSHSAFIAEMNDAVLPAPVLIIDQVQYMIYFLDADSGVWHGKGLRFTQGEKILPISRKTYNQEGKAFNFQDSGGQCSVDTSSNIFAAEVNFFYQRSQSMIVVMYALDTASGRLLLDSISITPFRCGHGCDFPLKPPQDQVRGSIDSFIRSLEGKSCRRQWRSYTRALDETDGGEVCSYPTSSIKSFSNRDRVIQLFDDDLVCSIPPDLPAGGACELVFGCFHTPSYAHMVTLTYGSNGKIDRYTAERWS